MMEAVETYLNEHLLKHPVEVVDVSQVNQADFTIRIKPKAGDGDDG